MAIVFSCIVPHTPLLLPSIGKEHIDALQDTIRAIHRVEQELYIAHPTVIVILSPHGVGSDNALSIHVNERYTANLQEFGDIMTNTSWRPHRGIIGRLQAYARSHALRITTDSAEYVDYGVSVPLIMLTNHLPNIPIVPINTSGDNIKAHITAGRAIKEVCTATKERVAIIASADLSHRTKDDSPAGFSPMGAAFDDNIRDIITRNALHDMVDIPEQVVREARACGTATLATLFGIVEDMNRSTNVLSYQNPFGVGYLTATITTARQSSNPSP